MVAAAFAAAASQAKSKIAFIQLDDDGQWDLWMMNEDGSEQERLTDGEIAERFPSWSPDGKRIVCAANTGDLKIIDVEKGTVETLQTPPKRNAEPAWSPDGKSIAFISYPPVPQRRSILWITDMIKGDWIARSIPLPSAQKGFPCWSPDGKKIAMSFLKEIKPGGPVENISILDMETMEFELLIPSDEHDNLHPAWSPDGKKIAFSSNRSGNYDLWMKNIDSEELIQLTKNKAFDGDPTWSPDGNSIVFVSSRKGKKNIWSLNLETMQETQITFNNRGSRDPAFYPVFEQ